MDSNVKALREERNTLMQQAGDLAAKPTTENRAKFDQLMSRVDELEKDISNAERVSKFEAEQRSFDKSPRPQIGNDGLPQSERRSAESKAFEQWFRTGEVSAENRGYLKGFHETRDLGTGTPSAPITGGGVLVPTGFDPVLHDAVKDYGQIVDAVGQLQTSSGGVMNVALSNDTGNGLVVVGQAETAPEVDPTFSTFQSNTDLLSSGVVKITNQLLQDSEFNLANWIDTALATRYYRGLSNFIINGNGLNIQALAPELGITSASPVISYADLVGLYGSLDNGYISNANFVMSSTTRATLMGIISTTGQPILQADVNGVPFNSLFGRSIVIAEQLPQAAAGNSPIFFGDLKNSYILRRVTGFGVKRLNELGALQDETYFVLFARAGGYNLTPGTYPLRSLVMHA
jgi:HK97 family phage major capsid protein